MARYKSPDHRGKVLVDGEVIDRCIECDTELGFAVVYVRGSDGNWKLNGDEIKTELLTGKVQFLPMDQDA